MKVISPLSPPAFPLQHCSSTGKKWEPWARSVEVTLALTTLPFYLQLRALQRHEVQVSKLSRSYARPSALKVPRMSPKRIFCLCRSPRAWGDTQPFSLHSPRQLRSSRLEISDEGNCLKASPTSMNLRGLLAIKYGDHLILARVKSSF